MLVKVKRQLICFVMMAAVAISFCMPVSASAHGHHSSSCHYTVCTKKNCTKTGTHKHHGVTYAGHYAACTRKNCTKTGTHRHHGVTYAGHHN